MHQVHYLDMLAIYLGIPCQFSMWLYVHKYLLFILETKSYMSAKQFARLIPRQYIMVTLQLEDASLLVTNHNFILLILWQISVLWDVVWTHLDSMILQYVSKFAQLAMQTRPQIFVLMYVLNGLTLSVFITQLATKEYAFKNALAISMPSPSIELVVHFVILPISLIMGLTNVSFTV